MKSKMRLSETLRIAVSTAIAVGAIAVSNPLWAHHSSAGVDMTQTLVIKGTLKEFDYSAPHSAVVVVYSENGKTLELKIWTVAPTQLRQQGFAPKDFHPGDKVELSYHPNRNGVAGGIMAELKLPGGRVVKGMSIG